MNKELIDYGGVGFNFSKENGDFVVKAFGEEFEFKKLSEAKKYYDNINDEKAIWDRTGMPELLDCKVYKSN